MRRWINYSFFLNFRTALVTLDSREEPSEQSASHPSALSPAEGRCLGGSPGSPVPQGPTCSTGQTRAGPSRGGQACAPQHGGAGLLTHTLPGQGPTRPLTASPCMVASPLCELCPVYPPTSLFHSGTRAINQPAGTAEPSVAQAGGRGGMGMVASTLPRAGRAPRVPPWWLGAQPFP